MIANGSNSTIQCLFCNEVDRRKFLLKQVNADGFLFYRCLNCGADFSAQRIIHHMLRQENFDLVSPPRSPPAVSSTVSSSPLPPRSVTIPSISIAKSLAFSIFEMYFCDCCYFATKQVVNITLTMEVQSLSTKYTINYTVCCKCATNGYVTIVSTPEKFIKWLIRRCKINSSPKSRIAQDFGIDVKLVPDSWNASLRGDQCYCICCNSRFNPTISGILGAHGECINCIFNRAYFTNLRASMPIRPNVPRSASLSGPAVPTVANAPSTSFQSVSQTQSLESNELQAFCDTFLPLNPTMPLANKELCGVCDRFLPQDPKAKRLIKTTLKHTGVNISYNVCLLCAGRCPICWEHLTPLACRYIVIDWMTPSFYRTCRSCQTYMSANKSDVGDVGRLIDMVSRRSNPRKSLLLNKLSVMLALLPVSTSSNVSTAGAMLLPSSQTPTGAGFTARAASSSTPLTS